MKYDNGSNTNEKGDLLPATLNTVACGMNRLITKHTSRLQLYLKATQ
jgi:hypothetical protein